MLRWKGSPCFLYLHTNKFALYQQMGAQTSLIHAHPFDPATFTAALGPGINACLEHLPARRTHLDIMFDDSHARYWRVTPPEQISHLSDLRATAALRFQSLFDLPSDTWQIEADWNAQRDFLACALPAALVNQVHQLLKSHSKSITSSACWPHFIQQWNQYASQLGKPRQAFAVVGDGSMTLALTQNRAIKSVRSLPFFSPDSDSLKSHLQNLEPSIHAHALQLGIDAPQEILLAGKFCTLPDEIQTGEIRWRTPSRAGSGTLVQSAREQIA